MHLDWKLIIAISGWLAALFMGVLDLPSKVNSFFAETPKAYESVLNWWNLNTKITGTWTSNIEGWADATEEDHRNIGGDLGPVAI